MKLADLLKDTGVACPPEWENDAITGICCDSRRVEAGSLFVCISGTAVDGHDYAAQAVRNGASVVITEHPLGLPRELHTASGRFTWARMCANRFGNPAGKLHMIGVTGTNGKTTTTYLLKAILEAAGHKVGLIGTIQNMIGDRVLTSGHTTPDPYDLHSMLALMVAEGCTHAVMEVSSHALAQDRVEGCHFDVGIFTNLTQDHLDYHGTMVHYMEAKKRLFLQCDAAVMNRDDPWFSAMCDGLTCPVTTFSVRDTAADFAAEEIAESPAGATFALSGAAGQRGRVSIHTPGRFSVYNALGALATCFRLGVPAETIIAALAATSGVKGRAEVVPTGRPFTVVIDYAHTPDGIVNICKTLDEVKKGRLITVFGCGGDRDKTKRPKMGAAAAELSDFLVVTSDNPRTEEPDAIIADILVGLADHTTPYRVIPNRTEAIHWAIAHAEPDDVVLLAGKGHETYQVLKTGIIHLDEREIVADALKEKGEK